MSSDHQTLFEVSYYLALHLTKALTAFIQRDSFLFWPFLLSGAVLALVAAIVTAKALAPDEKRSWWSIAREYFGAKVWWHRSARADYRLYLANALLLPLIFGVLLFTDTHVASLIDSVLGRTPLSPQRGGESASIASRVLLTVIFFIAYDFGRFVAHTLLHDVPLLWEFHKVHHSAETLNFITTFRAHPIDLLVMAWVPVIMTGLATWTFNQFTATPVSFYKFLGLHALIFAFNLIGILRHSPVWLSFGPRWGKWFISPAHHQLHHSYEPHHVGCNRGFELAIWDRLYGTLYVPGKRENFRMGLGDGTDGEWHTVRRMYWWPFANAVRRAGLAPRKAAKFAASATTRERSGSGN